jgi:hypothetical protein
MERCKQCRKKSIVIQVCKCTARVCLQCTSPESHGCTFDHAAEWKQALKDRNPTIVGKRLDPI